MLSGQGLVWPESLEAGFAGQSGYTASKRVYLDGEVAEGLSITLTEGTAAIYVGPPDGAHDLRAVLVPGSTRLVTGAASGTVVSVQGTAPFSYELTMDAEVPGEPLDPTDPVEPEPTEPCTDVTVCDVVTAVESSWQCNIEECHGSPWAGAAISWPTGTAYSSNDRPGDASRTAFDVNGQELHPYAGSWIDGCQVEVVWGTVLVVEWRRGANDWRETLLSPGDTYTVDLRGDEDGALIEGYPFGFGVRLTTCDPQQLADL
ncbi:hypothetical protein [Isoptericola chiayiensis]|uniref:hypothetical protein n=1 Tax=Isoptericola chiayiensis TaxID=579446 RepID=UPI001557E104|nr:hypothetical protein [Isoptericola chiayiensis]NOV99427.1 hypothetical protein [Isoptericola chiayiensis]